MFVILDTYVKPMEEVERVLPAHREFLAQHYASGAFICSGPMNPRTGGVILCSATSNEEVDAIINQDPFFTEGVAEYEVIEFDANTAAPMFQGLVGL